jgi:hypothetical protein
LPVRRASRAGVLALVVGLLAGLFAGLLGAVVAAPAEAGAAARTTHHHATHHRAAHHHGSSRQVPRSFFGIHDASQHAYGRIPFGAIRLWDAGVTWQDIEVSPGVYHWHRLDSLVRRAQKHHVKVTLVLAMTPTFYAAQSTEPPRVLSRYAHYVRAVMHRYRNFHGHRGIEAYQVWNEGNVKTFWTGSPQQLAQLTAVVARARRAVDPGAKVIAPSFATRLTYQRRWMGDYQHQKVGGRHVWTFYDVNALSLYPRDSVGSRTGGPEDAFALLQDVRRRLRHAGVPSRKPIWASEINYGLPVGVPGQQNAAPISERRQAANLLRTYLLGAARGLGRIYWFRYDMPLHPGGGTTGNTLLSNPGNHTRVTAAGRAMRIAQRWLRGRLVSTGRHHHPCARNAHGTYTCTVRYRSGTRTIMWNPHRDVRVRVPQVSGRGAVAGRSRAGHRSTVHVGYRPVMVRSGR